MEYFERSVNDETGEPMNLDETPNPVEHTIASVSTIPIESTNFIDQAQSRTNLTEGMKRFLHSHHRSWRLQEIVGERTATPYTKPPNVTSDMVRRFSHGLLQLEKRENDDKTLWNDSVQTMLVYQQRASWPSNQSIAYNRRDSGVAAYESGISNHSSPNPRHHFGSNTTGPVNQYFQTEKSTAASHSFPMQTSSSSAQPGHDQILPQSIGNLNSDRVSVTGFSIPDPSRQANASIQNGHDITFLNTLPGFANCNVQRNESEFRQILYENGGQVAIFPSLGLQEGSYETLQPAIDLHASKSHLTGLIPDAASHDQAQRSLGRAYQNSWPQNTNINVQLPSPTNLLYSNMRPLPPIPDEESNHSQMSARADDHTGLPFVAGDESMAWTSGYTPDVACTLTEWTTMMLNLYNICPHPSAFTNNWAFPWPIEPLTYHKLVAVAFYDASEKPSKEIRFIGPGDGNDITYGEVDVFRSTNSYTDHNEQLLRKSAVAKIKDRIHYDYRPRHMSPEQRAEIGEGQWTYIHMQPSSTSAGKRIPFVMIAFPTCAITFRSNSPHNVFPDNYNPILPSMQNPYIGRHTQSSYRRLATMQSHAAAQRDPKRLQQFLRMASPPEFKQPYTGPQEGTPTLFRTMLELGKAGRVPLIDGHGVDSLKFTPWLQAAGNGAGRVIMWTEMKFK